MTGYRILAWDGELGRVADLLRDNGIWRIRYLVVLTGGWLRGRTVLLAPAWTVAVEWERQAIRVDLEREAIRTAPAYDPDRNLDREDEIRLYAHYSKEGPADVDARRD